MPKGRGIVVTLTVQLEWMEGARVLAPRTIEREVRNALMHARLVDVAGAEHLTAVIREIRVRESRPRRSGMV